MPKTLEQIQQKLEKAKELRELEQTKKIGQKPDERLSRARERRSNFVTQQTTKIRNALDVKMEGAVQKRSERLNVIVQKAQKENVKLDKASQYRQDQQESMKTKHQIALEKLNQTQMKKEQLAKDTVLKAKKHSDMVLGVVQTKKEKEALNKKTSEQNLEQKLKDAQNRKDTITKQKVQTAQMLQSKRSPSKELPKKEE